MISYYLLIYYTRSNMNDFNLKPSKNIKISQKCRKNIKI